MIRTEIQVRFSDIDMLGHINNVVLQSYYDLGKMEYFKQVMGLGAMWRGETFIVVNVNTNYFEEVRANTNFYLTSRIVKVGTKSVNFVQEIVDADTQAVKSRCESVLVAFDLKSRQGIEVREELRAMVVAHEGDVICA